MYNETKRRDVRLLLVAEVPQKLIAQQLGGGADDAADRP